MGREEHQKTSPSRTQQMDRDDSPPPCPSQKSIMTLCHPNEREANTEAMVKDDIAVEKKRKKVNFSSHSYSLFP